MKEPRSAKAAGKAFPYTVPTVCYIEITKDGTVSQGGGREAYTRALTEGSRLYAVWPGQWSSDLFLIDDLEEYGRAIGILHDAERTGLADHEHQVRWAVSPYESNPDSAYISISIWLDCGCAIRDIKAFAEHMRQQQRWDIATTTGWSSGGERYTVRVRRKSLQS